MMLGSVLWMRRQQKNIGEAAEAKKNRDALVNKNIDSAEKKQVASQTPSSVLSNMELLGIPNRGNSAPESRCKGAERVSLKKYTRGEAAQGDGVNNDQKAAAAP